MTLASCPECGTQVTAGELCPVCGTLTPTPAPPAPPSGPPPTPSGETGFRHQWEVIQEKLESATAPKYQVRSILGYGGMAGVFLADEPRLGRQVAIKVMAPAMMVDPSLVERFGQEARTIAQLNHPNIVTIYEVDDRDGLHYFTMTFVAGRTLGEALAEATEPLPIAVVRALFYQVGDALGYAHQRGVVHRDVKPGNVLLDPRGSVLVTDFGIAKIADSDSGLTRTGMLVGTPAYMSPEQCSSVSVTGASDQYSLGVMIYQMLTGRPPFSGSTFAVLNAHVTQQPPPLTDLRPDCPADLASAVEKMLRKEPEERWPTVSAAVAAAGATAPELEGPVRDQLKTLAVRAAGISVAPRIERLREGSREPMEAIVFDARGHALQGRRIDWTSRNEAVVSVREATLSAAAPGETEIEVRCGSARTAFHLTVDEDPVAAVGLEPETLSVEPGERRSLRAIVSDWDGTAIEDRVIRWSSSDPSVVVTDSDGAIECVGEGRAVVTASTGGKSARVAIAVGARAIAQAAADAAAKEAAAKEAAAREAEAKEAAAKEAAAREAEAREAEAKKAAAREAAAREAAAREAEAKKAAANEAAANEAAAKEAAAKEAAAREAAAKEAAAKEAAAKEAAANEAAAKEAAAKEAAAKEAAAKEAAAKEAAAKEAAAKEAAAKEAAAKEAAAKEAAAKEAHPALPTTGESRSSTDSPPPRKASESTVGGTRAPKDQPPRRKAPRRATTPPAEAARPGPRAVPATPTPRRRSSRATLVRAGAAGGVVVAVLLLWRPWRSSGPEPATSRPAPAQAENPTPPAGSGATDSLAGASPSPRQESATGASTAPESTAVAAPRADTVRRAPPTAVSGERTPPSAGRRTAGEAVTKAGPTATPSEPVTGTVEITGALPPGAAIEVRGPDGAIRVVRDRSISLAPGSYLLRFSAPGYDVDEDTIRVSSGGTTAWAPTVTAVPPPTTAPAEPTATPPAASARDVAAETAAIDAAIQRWGKAFNDRDAGTVVPLMPAETRQTWRALLTNRGAVTDFRARVDTVEAPVITGDDATVAFSITIAFRSGNAPQRQTLTYLAKARRAGSGWKLLSLAKR